MMKTNLSGSGGVGFGSLEYTASPNENKGMLRNSSAKVMKKPGTAPNDNKLPILNKS